MTEGYIAALQSNLKLQEQLKQAANNLSNSLTQQDELRKQIHQWKRQAEKAESSQVLLQGKLARLGSEAASNKDAMASYLSKIEQARVTSSKRISHVEEQYVAKIKSLSQKVHQSVLDMDKAERRARNFHRSQMSKLAADYEARIAGLKEGLETQLEDQDILALVKADYQSALKVSFLRFLFSKLLD